LIGICTEITRLPRNQVQIFIESTKNAAAQHRAYIAALRRRAAS